MSVNVKTITRTNITYRIQHSKYKVHMYIIIRLKTKYLNRPNNLSIVSFQKDNIHFIYFRYSFLKETNLQVLESLQRVDRLTRDNTTNNTTTHQFSL